jgi:uncharacterized oligopeptide transporter (OPT) family protein
VVEAIGKADGINRHVVNIVRVIFENEIGIKARLVQGGAPVIRVWSSAVCATIVLEVFVGFVVCCVIGGFWGLIGSPVLTRGI